MLDNFINPKVFVSPVLNKFEIQKDDCYLKIKNKFGMKYFDIKKVGNKDIIIFNFLEALKSVLPKNTDFDLRNTFTNTNLASWRRDKDRGKRNYTIIYGLDISKRKKQYKYIVFYFCVIIYFALFVFNKLKNIMGYEGYQSYRDKLAKEIINISKDKRNEYIVEARKTEKYQKADIFKIEDRYRKLLGDQYREFEKHDITFDIDNPPNSFDGFTGKYRFELYSRRLLDSVVSNETGKKFFITTKKPERQALASLIGKYLSEKDPFLKRLQFPEILLEKINGQTVAFMEYFDGYNELKFDFKNELNFFTDREKAFLEIYNLWIGNWDFKYDHALYTEGDQKNPFLNESQEILNNKKSMNGKIGLIDLEMSFDFDREDRIRQTVRKSIFLSEELSDENKNSVLNIINSLDVSDRNKLIKYAVDSGFEPEKTISIIFDLMKRRDILDKEIKDIRRLYNKKILISFRYLYF